MRTRSRALRMFVLIALLATTSVSAMPAIASGPSPTTVYHGSLTLSPAYTATNWGEVWDLTQCDLTLSYTIDMTGITQPAPWQTSYTEVGLRELGASDFNPGPWDTYQGGKGGWMVSLVGDLTTNPNSQDLDDKHNLAASGGRDERDYDATDPDTVVAPFGTYVNYGIWFDRDGVDPWQAVYWGMVDGGTYNTGGIYHIEISYHAINPNLGTMFATINGIPTGFYTAGWKPDQPDIYPAGLSFKGDMAWMQLFAGLWAPDDTYGDVVLSDITITGCMALPAPPVVKVDDDWADASPKDEVLPGWIFGYNAFATIQDGVNAVADGGKVIVHKGTYEEQVVVDGKNLTLEGRPRYKATILAVPDQKGPIVWVKNADRVIVRNFTIDGDGRGYPGCVSGDERFQGIYYLNASGKIQWNKIKGVKHPPGYEGCQSGGGIYVLSRDGGTSEVWIERNTVRDFQKNGITANSYYGNSTTIAHIKKNRVYGWGPTDKIAQNGIQIGFGATGSIYNNNYVADVSYIGGYWVASGYLLYDADGAKVMSSKVERADYGLGIWLSDDVYVQGMRLLDSLEGADVWASDNLTFERNIVRNNHANAVFSPGYGIWIGDSNNARLAFNRFVNNDEGIMVDTCDGVLALKNLIKDNDIGIHLYCATNFQEVGNRFRNNGQDIVDEGCPMVNSTNATEAESSTPDSPVSPVEP